MKVVPHEMCTLITSFAIPVFFTFALTSLKSNKLNA